MSLKLIRKKYLSCGIFGELIFEKNNFNLITLEHSYPVLAEGEINTSSFAPKLPIGTYLCIRGKHQLDHSKVPFETFEVTKVPNHSGILFHVGNWNKNSDGCILVGLFPGPDCILRSHDAFEFLMLYMKGVDSFNLTVV